MQSQYVSLSTKIMEKKKSLPQGNTSKQKNGRENPTHCRHQIHSPCNGTNGEDLDEKFAKPNEKWIPWRMCNAHLKEKKYKK